MIFLLYILSILSDAIGDAFRDTKKKESHIFQALAVGFLLLVSFFHFKALFLLSYLLFRIALFDYAYNVARGLEITFVGSTSYYDILLSKFNPVFIMFVKFICLLIGIYLFLI